MTGTLLLIAAVLATVGGVFVAADHLGRRFALAAEVRRKLVHFGSGFLALSFPWLFDEFWPVAVICSLSLVVLLVIRVWRPLREGVGDSIHGVERHSLGDFVVPIATATLFLMASDDRVLYVVPLLLLTLADASAALVAIRYGLSPYPTLDGKKTYEGTVVFFAVASWAVLVPLLLYTDLGRPEVLLVTLLVALITSLIEASSWSGLDNVFIPWGGYFALRRCLPLGSPALVTELAVLVVLAVLIFLGAPRSRLSVQAGFLALLGTFFVWTLVGWPWVAPAVMLIVLHPLLVPIPGAKPAHVDLRAVISVGACTVWAVLEQVGVAHLERNLYAFTVGLAAHLVMVADVRLRTSYPPEAVADHVKWSAVSTAAMLVWYVGKAAFTPRSLVLSACAFPVVLATSWVFASVPARRLTTRCWVVQGYFGLQASAVAFVLHSLVSELL